MRTDGDSLRGAYGLRIAGPAAADPTSRSYLVPANSDWPTWEVRWDPTGDAAGPPVESFSTEAALLSAQPGGHVIVDRASASTTLHFPSAPSPQAVVHPHLASTGVVANHWLGRTPFHAGAFEFEGRAWGVLGGREMGKSSLLMWLYRAGLPILTDDVLVLHEGVTFAGPRCLDLRKGAAEQFEAGEFLGVVGGRERWRVTLPPVASEVPFGGWVFLGWSDQLLLDRPTPSVRLAALSTHRGLTAQGVGMTGLLDLVTFPMVHFARPQHWDRMDEAMGRLLDSLRSMGGGK